MVLVAAKRKLVWGKLQVSSIAALDTFQSPGYWPCLENHYKIWNCAVRWKLSTGMQITELVWDLFGSFINNHWYMCYWGILFSAWTLGMTSAFLVVNAFMATKISAFSCLFCIVTSCYINCEHQQHGGMWQPLTCTVTVNIPALLRARSILLKHMFLYIFRLTGAFSH